MELIGSIADATGLNSSHYRRVDMGWIIALIVGGIAGWLASLVMSRNSSMGIFWNIVVGCIGSLIGNLL